MNHSKEIKVTVCSITYNHAQYIRACLDSILMQKTNFAFEIVINDDCSTDGTTEILKEYETRFPDIIRPIYHKENQYSKGVRDVFQRFVFPNARGRYCAICEGDDYWIDPLKLQKQYDMLEADKRISYCFTNRLTINEVLNKTRVDCHKDKIYTLLDFLSGFNPGIQNAMFRKAVYEKFHNKNYDQLVNGDRLIPFYCLQEGYAKCLQEITAVYRVTGSGVSTSLSKTYTDKQWFIHSTDDFYKFHKVVGFPSRKSFAKKAGLQLYFYFKKQKFRSINCAYKQTARYNDSYSSSLFLLVWWEAFKYGSQAIGKVINKKIYAFADSIYRKLKSTHFSSYILDMNGNNIEDVYKMPIVYSATTPSLNLSNKSTTIADAFLFSNGEKMWMFYELQEHLHSKGLLMSVCTEDGHHWSKPELVLEESCHLSFPFVFEDDGHIYMIPETSTINEIRLYEGTKDCKDFKYIKTIMAGSRYVDTCIYKKENLYYLFTSIQHDDNSYTLELYTSDSILGEWQVHPSSPISVGKCCERNAGTIIEHDGMLLRPAQEARVYYAQNTHIFRIVKLTPLCYQEEPYKLDIIPKGLMNSIGGHQFSVCVFNGKHYVAVDVLQKSFNLKALIKKFKK